MTTEENKLEILRRVENGTLTIQEGSDLIAMLDKSETKQAEPEVLDPVPPMEPFEKHEASGCWKAAWSMFLVGGAILTAFSAFWAYKGFKSHPFGWGFWLSWIPMIIGIALMIFGWALMESPWMHVRFKSQEPNRRAEFILSIPVPFNIARWVFDNFGQYMPEKVKKDEILDLLDQAEISIKKGEPFQVQVTDQEDGRKIDVFIN